VRFGDKHWTAHLNQAARDFKFNATLKPRLDIEIKDWHDSQPGADLGTVVLENTESGTTPLGGPISIHYEWADERETDPTA
jgi:hypothetical protein